MHVNFVRLKEKVQREQERSTEMQNQIFQMMKEVQKFAIEEAQRSARVLGDVSQQCGRFHNRCIPQYKQKSYELGISAVKHREKRNSLEKENNVDREKAEDMLKEKRLASLNVWEDCIPVVTEPAKVSNRDSRVKPDK